MSRVTIDFIESATIISLLRSLGLTKYETLAYLSLIKNGPQNRKSLTSLTEIPSGKIYTVVKNLTGEGWIRVSMNERPMILYAVDPEVTIKKRIIELREKLNLLETNSSRVLAVLKPKYNNFYFANNSRKNEHYNIREKLMSL